MSGMRLSMRVWDLPVRLFHWIVTLLLIGSFLTMYTRHFGWHILIGETLLSLVLWRVVWGFVGSDTARFARFLRSPAAAFAHLRGIGRREVDNGIGHTAAGGWWVLVMLTLLFTQTLTGLFGSEDGKHGGPLFHLLPAKVAAVLGHLHGANFLLLMFAIGIHLLAVGAYAGLKGQNLLRPMISGKKRLPANMRAPRMATTGLAGLVLLCAAAVVALVINGLTP